MRGCQEWLNTKTTKCCNYNFSFHCLCQLKISSFTTINLHRITMYLYTACGIEWCCCSPISTVDLTRSDRADPLNPKHLIFLHHPADSRGGFLTTQLLSLFLSQLQRRKKSRRGTTWVLVCEHWWVNVSVLAVSWWGGECGPFPDLSYHSGRLQRCRMNPKLCVMYV